jgi:hypothetical protein
MSKLPVSLKVLDEVRYEATSGPDKGKNLFAVRDVEDWPEFMLKAVKGFDNRMGRPDVYPDPYAFGFVYFTDGARVGYSFGEVWPGNWEPVNGLHLVAAARYLDRELPGWRNAGPAATPAG